MGDLRAQVANGTTERGGSHGLEKRLAKAQNWVVSPPTANSVEKGPASPSSPSSALADHWQLFGGKQLVATIGNLYD
jgi:hypothetical protein